MSQAGARYAIDSAEQELGATSHDIRISWFGIGKTANGYPVVDIAGVTKRDLPAGPDGIGPSPSKSVHTKKNIPGVRGVVSITRRHAYPTGPKDEDSVRTVGAMQSSARNATDCVVHASVLHVKIICCGEPYKIDALPIESTAVAYNLNPVSPAGNVKTISSCMVSFVAFTTASRVGSAVVVSDALPSRVGSASVVVVVVVVVKFRVSFVPSRSVHNA
jgi:hypothetical protein